MKGSWRTEETWWRHQMETFSALLAICAGNSPVPGEFPTQRPVTRNFDVYFDLRPNKRLSKLLWGWWFETQSRPLWRHRNEMIKLHGDLMTWNCLRHYWTFVGETIEFPSQRVKYVKILVFFVVSIEQVVEQSVQLQMSLGTLRLTWFMYIIFIEPWALIWVIKLNPRWLPRWLNTNRKTGTEP